MLQFVLFFFSRIFFPIVNNDIIINQIELNISIKYSKKNIIKKKL